MNYRHAYHAGNFADVLKHAALVAAIEHLRRKDKPFVIIDSHAGAGAYDLTGEAARTGEWRDGLGRLLAAGAPPPPVERYLAIVAELNGGSLAAPRWYPGSPRIARALLRPQDRLIAAELHPAEAEQLRVEFSGDRQVQVHAMDGWTALKAWLPPQERRGFVLIDPPFEAKDEFERLARGLKAALRRWANGTYLVWLPLKHPAAGERLVTALAEATPPGALLAELRVGGRPHSGTLDACALIAVNPPWTLENTLREMLPWLAETLARGPGAGWRLTATPTETRGD